MKRVLWHFFWEKKVIFIMGEKCLWYLFFSNIRFVVMKGAFKSMTVVVVQSAFCLDIHENIFFILAHQNDLKI